MANELTKASLDGNSTKVPIGAPVITNNKALNSKSIQSLMTGASITKPSIDTIEALGFDGKQITRDTKTNSFGYVEPEQVNAEKSVQWSFDNTNGSVTFVRSNGDVFTISGFLRQEDFGIGPTGTRGDPGSDGRNGRDGIDGIDGPSGCAGTTGLEGRRGEEGEFGEEGPVGPTGLVGPVGPTGPSGIQGPEGLPGLEGRRGLKGFSCPTTLRGPDGPEGRTMNEFAGLANFPSPTDLIWAAPEDCLCYYDPAKAKWVGGIKPVILTTQVKQIVLQCSAGQTIGGVWKAPTSAVGTYIETIWSDGTVETTTPDYKGAFCAPEVYRQTYRHTGTANGLNMQTSFGNPTIPGVYTFINDGVIGGVAGGYSLRTGSFPAGSTLIFINNGEVIGAGGDGGFFYSNSTLSSPVKGSDGLLLEFPTQIQNGNLIAGGGGGGGAAGEWGGSNDYHVPGGGGAGIPGGRSNVGGWKGTSYPGTKTAGGKPYGNNTSGQGGSLGQDGYVSTIRLSNDYQKNTAGAPAGRAIVGAGYITSSSGLSAPNVLGAIV